MNQKQLITRKSSIFARARNSFVRSRGERGADVDTLRGNAGADFESEAIVSRGSSARIFLFSCFGLGRGRLNGGKSQYILIKGPHLFVFTKATSSCPKFAIPLKHETVQICDCKGTSQIVKLSNTLGDVEYEFKFDLSENTELGRNFGCILEEQIAVGNTDEVKEKLGHQLCKNSKSFMFAKSIGEKKEQDQPELLTSSNDVNEELFGKTALTIF